MTKHLESRLKLRQIALVIAIHDTGSLRKASDELNVTQPAATNALQELEFALGVPLFTRSKSGMKPTSFGAAFVERARLIMSNIHSAAEEIRQLHDGSTGQLSVGALPAAAMTIVPQAIMMAHAVRPKLSLRVVEGSIAQLLPSLRNGEIDLLVGRIPLERFGENLRHEVLSNEPNEVVCRAGHPLARHVNPTLQMLARESWILPEEGSHVRSEIQNVFRRAGVVPPEPALVTSSTTVRLTLLSISDMVGVLTQRLAESNERQGVLKILRLGIQTNSAPVLVLTLKDGIVTPAAASFVEFLRTATARQEAAAPAATLSVAH